MPETIAAWNRGETVTVTRLVRLDFASGPMFLHTGFGPLATRAPGNAGGPITTVWQGVGQVGQISDIERAVVPSGGAPTLTLSGVDPSLIAKTLGDPADYKGRPALIFEQFFDAQPAVLDAPLAIYAGLMDRLSAAHTPEETKITLALVTPLYKRRRPAYAYLSAANQRSLYPGDQGANEIPRIPQTVLKWPQY